MQSFYIKNATIVNEGKTFTGDLLTQDEYIKSVGLPGSFPVPENTQIIDATGLILIPGVIDDQVHFREPGLTHKGEIHTESRAAVAGGVTSFMEMPNTVPQTTTITALNDKEAIAAERSFANYTFFFGATNSNIEEIKALDPRAVCGIKLFMGSSTGNMLVDNESSLRQLFSTTPLPVAAHCEDEMIIRKNSSFYLEKYGDDVPIKMHPLIRNHEACYKSSSYAASLAREYGSRLHILHLSTAEELSIFDNNLPLKEKKITSEVCIHHLWFDDSSYDTLGTSIKWNPAIKTAADRTALIKGLIDNHIDILATDHAPHTIEEKQRTYFKAPSGGPLVQHSLVLMLELWHKGAFSIEKIVEKMCHNPAILFGISKRGFLREGYKADLCVVDPKSEWTVSKENLLYKCGWSPFEGTTLKSRVKKTFVNGSLVYDNGIIDEDFRGQKLTFDR